MKGKITKGMAAEAVTAVLGHPTDRLTAVETCRGGELWNYVYDEGATLSVCFDKDRQVEWCMEGVQPRPGSH